MAAAVDLVGVVETLADSVAAAEGKVAVAVA
jgi:hypothetical protein